MSDSPRWHLDGLPGTTGIVEVMLYDDHLAAVEEALQRGAGLAAMAWSSHMQRAVAAAEQRVMKSATDRDPDFTTSGYLRGKRDGRREGVKAAREAIRNTPTDPRWNILQIERSFLAAIDGVQP